jgi:hypothetical protein
MESLVINPQVITDNTGNKLGVFLSLADYEKLLEELEDYEDIKALQAFENRPDKEFISLKQALDEIDQGVVK